jgi:hypothetical protein
MQQRFIVGSCSQLMAVREARGGGDPAAGFRFDRVDANLIAGPGVTG